MALDRRTAELVAVGASVGANCTACLEYHLAEARKAGAADQDILAATGVGTSVRRGAAGQVDKLLGKLPSRETAEAAAQPGRCCG